MVFQNILIIILLCIIVMFYINIQKQHVCENYTNNDMNKNESDTIMKACTFSLNCCPSLYSNDKGCMCMDKQTSEVLSTRGYNKTHVDGFGY